MNNGPLFQPYRIDPKQMACWHGADWVLFISECPSCGGTGKRLIPKPDKTVGFLVGDVVVLNSGGSRMTVASVREAKDEYSCTWRHNGEVRDGVFRGVTIKRIDEPVVCNCIKCEGSGKVAVN